MPDARHAEPRASARADPLNRQNARPMPEAVYEGGIFSIAYHERP